MRYIFALLFALAFTPAHAANELKGVSIQHVIADAETNKRITVEKLNEADSAKLDEATHGRPLPNSTIYLLRAGDTLILALVVDDVIQFSSSVVKAETVDKALGR